MLLWAGRLVRKPACRGVRPETGFIADWVLPPLVLKGVLQRLGKAPVPLLASFVDSCGRNGGLSDRGVPVLPLDWALRVTKDDTLSFGGKYVMPVLGWTLRCCTDEMLPVPASAVVLEADNGSFCGTFEVRAVRGEPLSARPTKTGKVQAAADLNEVLPDLTESGVNVVLAGTGAGFWKPGEAGNAGLALPGCLDSSEAGPAEETGNSTEDPLFDLPTWGVKAADCLAVYVWGVCVLDKGKEACAGSVALPVSCLPLTVCLSTV